MANPEHQTKLGEINEPGPEGSHKSDEKSVTEAAKERAAEEARHAREAAADTTREKAEQVREAGEAFDPESFARQITERVAEDLSHAAQSMRSADLGSLADDVSDFARRQPALFYGSAALLGFAAARMLKASERAEHGGGYDYGASDPWGTR
jgi:hypothetical protein